MATKNFFIFLFIRTGNRIIRSKISLKSLSLLVSRDSSNLEDVKLCRRYQAQLTSQGGGQLCLVTPIWRSRQVRWGDRTTATKAGSRHCYICNNDQQVCEYQQVLTSSELIEETKVYNERKCDDEDGDDKKKQDVSTGVRRLPHTD